MCHALRPDTRNKRHELCIFLHVEWVVFEGVELLMGDSYSLFHFRDNKGLHGLVGLGYSIFLPKLLFQLGLLFFPAGAVRRRSRFFSLLLGWRSFFNLGLFGLLGGLVLLGMCRLFRLFLLFRFSRGRPFGLRLIGSCALFLFSLSRLFLLGHNFINHSAGNINDISGAAFVCQVRGVSLFSSRGVRLLGFLYRGRSFNLLCRGLLLP